MISFGFDISGIYNLNDNHAFVYVLAHDNGNCEIEIVDSDTEMIDQNDDVIDVTNGSTCCSISVGDNEPMTIKTGDGNLPVKLDQIIFETKTIPTANTNHPNKITEITNARLKREQALFNNLSNPFNSEPIQNCQNQSKIHSPPTKRNIDEILSMEKIKMREKIKCTWKSRSLMLSSDIISSSKLNI